ncbi:hypothetical protein MD484_g6980, partial [Candolleomyces efflorescens]
MAQKTNRQSQYVNRYALAQRARRERERGERERLLPLTSADLSSQQANRYSLAQRRRRERERRERESLPTPPPTQSTSTPVAAPTVPTSITIVPLPNVSVVNAREKSEQGKPPCSRTQLLLSKLRMKLKLPGPGPETILELL